MGALVKRTPFVRTAGENHNLRMKFHRDKSLWRRAVRKAVERADQVSQGHMRGKFIGMGEMYETARQIKKIGDRGVRLRYRMDDYAIVKRDRVHEGISSACKLLEGASKVIQAIAQKQGTPLFDFPLFVSELATTSEVELGAQDALKSLMEDLK